VLAVLPVRLPTQFQLAVNLQDREGTASMMNARRHTFANTHMTLVSAPPQAKRDKQLQKGAEACARLSAVANGLLKQQRNNSRHPASHRHQGRGGSRWSVRAPAFALCK